MTQSPITVTYSLEEILGDIKQSIKEVNQKLDNLQKDVTDIKVGQAKFEAEIKGDIKAFDGKVDNIEKRLEKMEGTQEILIKDVSDLKGAKSLIIPIVVAVTTSLVTLLIRSLPNP